MSATILASTVQPSHGMTSTGQQSFALDAVLAAICVNPTAGLLIPCSVTLVLSVDGITYFNAETRMFQLNGTQFQVFKLSDYESFLVLNKLTSPWAYYKLVFSGNEGASVAVSVVGDSGLVSVPTVTPSGVLDTFGTSQGSLLYRDAAAWDALGPGTVGQVLQSGGASGNPAWGTAGAGTVTSVSLTGDGTVLTSSPSTPVTATGTLTAALATQAANTVLAGPTSGGAVAPAFRAIAPGDGSLSQATTYLSAGSPYTVARPLNATNIMFEGIGPGGGGGGGGNATSGDIFGGGGGAAGAKGREFYRVADITWPLTITVPSVTGSGGAGHVSGSAGSGSNGTAPGAITVINGATTYLSLAGGSAGSGGTPTTGAAGSGSSGQTGGSSGGASSVSANGTAGTAATSGGSSGGGGGGGVASAGTVRGGGAGGAASGINNVIGGTAGGAASSGGNGLSTNPCTNSIGAASGGGGGGGSAAGVPGTGGNGGSYGAGGGGGGGAQNTTNAGGTGGNGGPGILVMVAW